MGIYTAISDNGFLNKTQVNDISKKIINETDGLLMLAPGTSIFSAIEKAVLTEKLYQSQINDSFYYNEIFIYSNEYYDGYLFDRGFYYIESEEEPKLESENFKGIFMIKELPILASSYETNFHRYYVMIDCKDSNPVKFSSDINYNQIIGVGF